MCVSLDALSIRRPRMARGLWLVLNTLLLCFAPINCGYGAPYIPEEHFSRTKNVQSTDLNESPNMFNSLNSNHIGKAIEYILHHETHRVSFKCSRDLALVSSPDNSLGQTYLADAWGKPGSGILQGNWYWLGRASECRLVKFHGVAKNVKTVQSLVKFIMTQPSFPVPLVSGVCLPTECNENDIKEVFAEVAASLNITVNVRGATLPGDGEYDGIFGFAVTVFIIIGLLVAAGTGLDIFLSMEMTGQTEGYSNMTGNVQTKGEKFVVRRKKSKRIFNFIII